MDVTHTTCSVTGDMNARVGNDNHNYERVMSKHGLGERNDNGGRLCDLSDMNELVITGTLFSHKTIHKATWTSPDGTTKSQIDHILISRRFRNSVKDARVFRSADIGSDHYLVCMKVKLRLRNEPKGEKSTRVRYDTAKLRDENIRKAFSIALKNRYQMLEEERTEQAEGEDIERDFKVMEKAYTEVAETVLGRPRKKKKSWISDLPWTYRREGGDQ